LRELLAAYAGGAKDDGAFSTVFGKTVDEVSESFSAFVAERYGELARAMADVPVLKGVDEAPSPEVLRAALEKTPDTFQLHYALGQALMEASDLAGARAAFERAAALAPMAQGDESPRAMVARIAELQGDTSGAGDALQQLLVWDHDNVEAARRLVTLARTSGNSAAEGVALRVVADVDPFDADVHNALGRRSLAAKDYAAALPELLAAVALGPANPAEAHADVAEAYLGLGRKGEAKTAALKALEYSPTFARAQDLLLAAIGGE
jgi:tetratricopeptide (TPR) repeat protein